VPGYCGVWSYHVSCQETQDKSTFVLTWRSSVLVLSLKHVAFGAIVTATVHWRWLPRSEVLACYGLEMLSCGNHTNSNCSLPHLPRSLQQWRWSFWLVDCPTDNLLRKTLAIWTGAGVRINVRLAAAKSFNINIKFVSHNSARRQSESRFCMELQLNLELF